MKKSTTIIIILLLCVHYLNAQCYIQKTDVSGLDLSTYQSGLNQAACSARDSLPLEFQSQFKVVTFGFYVHSPSFISGIEQSINISKTVANIESPYYLFIARQSDSTGLFTRLYIDIKLPSSGSFSCIDSSKIQIIKQTVQQTITTRYQQNGNLPFMYADAEKSGIEVLSKLFGALKSGNCCLLTDETVENWLTSEGFLKLEVNSKVLGPLFARPSDLQNRSLNDHVEDFANLSIEIKGVAIDLEEKINNFINEKDLGSSNPKIYIIKNESICNGDYETAENEVINNLPYLGMIFYIQDRQSNYQPDNIWVRIEGNLLENLPNSVADNGEYVPPPVGASNFQDLVNTIRQAEDSLIAHGHTKIAERVKILRGIYYGTTWSMDFNQSYGSEIRNTGFRVYLCDNQDPINPQQILGNLIYQKLRDSPEVTNGSIGVDWGHIIIGLEARLGFCAREMDTPLHESSGLEITTWIGDIGGGAGMLAHKRVANPNKRAIDMFNGSSHDFGGWLNIEGDIAAYMVGRNTNSFDATPSFGLNDNQYIADAVQSYLLPQPSPTGSEWNSRGTIFLRMLGGTIVNNRLTNEESLVNNLAEEVEDFAENYVINMATGQNVDLFEASKHLKGASKEVTSLFINALKHVGTNPTKAAKPNNYNPDPTPPGEPYTKYEVMKKAEELKQLLEDWINNH